MKLLMIIVDTHCREELEVLLQRHGVAAYSEIPSAHGVGASGIRMGSGAHPATSSIFFTVLADEQVESIKQTIVGFCEASEDKMRMIQWAVEDVV
jgi:hypothetical protein